MFLCGVSLVLQRQWPGFQRSKILLYGRMVAETKLRSVKVKLVNTSILVFHESGKCFMDIQMHPI
jgi:hypothetical protein